MKISADKTLNIGAKRTLFAVSSTLLKMLSEKSLEEIRVGDLCESAMIPRATFYNYFYDKFDALEYLLDQISEEIIPPQEALENYTVTLTEIIDDMFDFFDEREALFTAIFKHNPEGSSFYQYFSNLVVTAANRLMLHCSLRDDYDIPLEIVTKIEAHGVLVVFSRKYIEGDNLTREEIHHILSRIFVRSKDGRTPFSE